MYGIFSIFDRHRYAMKWEDAFDYLNYYYYYLEITFFEEIDMYRNRNKNIYILKKGRRKKEEGI
jgi:hypothetical protein